MPLFILPRPNRARPTVRALTLVTGSLATVMLSSLVIGPSAASPAPAVSATIAPSGCVRWWRAPVSADIVDYFRPPENPYGPGNRGLEFNTSPGDPVTAVAGGKVVFAGPVGGSRFVVVAHGPQLKSTYGYLEQVQVRAGQTVQRAQPLATAETGFHLTARRSDRYIDPLPLLEPDCFVVRLVPVPDG